MSTHKKIDVICCIAVVLALLVTVLFMNAEAIGIQAADRAMGYEDRLFDETVVHTIDIVIEDWEGFLATCQQEEYSVCNVLIDGEAYTNVGIRGKGNISLSTVSSMDSERYSFKIEFDQYDSTKSYYGLDKLCLNNIIQDNTYMKDFLTYQMMAEFGVAAPLCSYVYITVNGEDWGLYLAVEGVEDAFLQRNYGSDYGELYKPDSLSMGGGRGNGREFDMEDIDFSQFEGFGRMESPEDNESTSGSQAEEGSDNTTSNPFEGGGFPGGGNMQMPQGGMQFPGMSGESSAEGSMPQGGMQFPEMSGEMQLPEGTEAPGSTENIAPDGKEFGGNMGNGFGMGSSDVKLQYVDDDASSYSNIFDNAKTDSSETDKERLVASLKTLSEGEDIASVVDIEEVIRYFVVHNFVVNGDSYTGSMIHNYYLYEEDGLLSMIPWDYNLAFGTFQSNDADSAVNDPIDSPVSGGSEDRPMVHWIFAGEEYTELYHQYFAEFMAEFFENEKLVSLIDSTAELIAPYVEKDPTKFCTLEEFETGVATIREFCLLRAESVSGQLDGTIPSTSDGQAADSSTLVDASGITLSDMGTMNMGGGGGAAPGNKESFGNFGGNRGNREKRGGTNQNNQTTEEGTSGESIVPEGMSGFPGNADGFNRPDAGTGSSTVQWTLLGASLACLLAGMLVAFKYRR